MPTYDYICDSCGYEFEKFHGISAVPPRVCPKCGGQLRRKIGAGVGLVFKGSGFYITDYKKGGSSSNNKSGDSSK